MIKHTVTIFHYYQDKDNPTKQTVTLNCDFATAYAFFMALLESHLDFKVEIAKGDNKDGCEQEQF